MSLQNASGLPVVDYEVLRFLRSFDRGSDSFFRRLADLYVKQTPIDLACLQALTAIGDFETAALRARSIRNRNADLGCLRMVYFLNQISASSSQEELKLLFSTLLEESKLVSVALTELDSIITEQTA